MRSLKRSIGTKMVSSEDKAAPPSEFRENAGALLRLSFSLVVQSLSGFGVGMSTFIWVGSLGPLLAGSMTLGNMYCNISGFSLIYGCATALDALCAQSYGAKQYRQLGLHTQRAILILTVLSIPVIILWSYAETLLHYVLFIPKDIAHHSGRWSRTLSAGLWPLLTFVCLQKWMQARNVIWPAVLTTTIGLVFNLSANYYNYRIIHGGFDGAALIVPLQNWLHLIVFLVILYVRKRVVRAGRLREASYDKLPSESSHGGSSGGEEGDAEAPSVEKKDSRAPDETEGEPDPEDDWPPLSMAVFDEWLPFLKLGVPGALSLFVEWGSFELAASIAGQLGAVGLAAHGVFMSTSGLFYMLPLSIAQATTTVAGHLIGANKAEQARSVLVMGIAMDTIYGLAASATLIFVLRPFWGSVFTSDQATRDLVFATMPFMSIYAFVDATKCITLNILRSGGLPNVTVWVNFIVCSIVMTPLGYYLAITRNDGLGGLWLSMSVAWGLATVAYGIILSRLDLRSLKVIAD